METYSKGQWGKDDDYNDDDVEWKGTRQTELVYRDFETGAEIVLGDESGFHIAVYCSENTESKYPFFAALSTGNRSWWYLVTDFPSVIMLLKEVQPLIKEIREQEAHEIRVEEHVWKVKQTDPDLFRRKCAHM